MTPEQETTINRRSVLTALSGLALGLSVGSPIRAAPARYRLDPDASSVGFTYTIAGTDQSGTMAIDKTDITLDPAHLSLARIDILLNVADVRTPTFIATRALRSASVLDVARFPTMRFTSTGVTLAQDGRLSGGAYISGQLTLRDVTRPIRLRADFFRQRGAGPNDLHRLSVHLTGQLNRSHYGATGYGDLVGDVVRLDIRAAIIALN